MQMMYETIYKALVEVGLEETFTPQDYLNFFCLGNREAADGSETLGTTSPTTANAPQVYFLCPQTNFVLLPLILMNTKHHLVQMLEVPFRLHSLMQ